MVSERNSVSAGNFPAQPPLPPPPPSQEIFSFARFFLSSHFDVSSRRSSLAVEISSGALNFLSVAAFALALNQQILTGNKTNEEKLSLALATAICCGISNLLFGLVCNFPLVLSPGIGLTAYFVFGLEGSGGFSPQQALTCCAGGGFLMIFFAILNGPLLLRRFIPNTIKSATMAGLGFFLGLLALKALGMIEIETLGNSGDFSFSLGNLLSIDLWLGLGGFLLLGLFLLHSIPGAILLSVFLISIVSWAVHGNFPSLAEIFHFPTFSLSAAMGGNLNGEFPPWAWKEFNFIHSFPAMLAFFLISLFEASGVFGAAQKIISIENSSSSSSSLASLQAGEGNSFSPDSFNPLPPIIRKSSQPSIMRNERLILSFIGCSMIISSLFGLPPLILSIESIIGIHRGGRTGISSMITGIGFLFSIPILNLFLLIPIHSMIGLYLFLSAMRIAEIKEIPWNSIAQAFPALLIILIIPMTFSIGNGILLGFLAYFIMNFLSWRNMIFSWFSSSSAEGRREFSHPLDYERIPDLDDYEYEHGVQRPSKGAHGGLSMEREQEAKYEDNGENHYSRQWP